MTDCFKFQFERAVASSDLTSTERLVALMWNMNSDYDTGTINAGRHQYGAPKIAKQAGFKSERTVRDATDSLISKGWMVETPRLGRASLYQLLIPTPASNTGVDDGTPASNTGVNEGTPASDEMTPAPDASPPLHQMQDNQNSNQKLKTQKEKSQNGAGSAPGSPEVVPHPPLAITDSPLASSTSDSPLAVPTKADAPSNDEPKDEVVEETDEVVGYEHVPNDAEWNPDGPVTNEPSKETPEVSEAVTEAPGGLLDPSQVEAEVASRAFKGTSLASWQEDVVLKCHEMIAAGYVGTWDKLIKDALRAVEW